VVIPMGLLHYVRNGFAGLPRSLGSLAMTDIKLSNNLQDVENFQMKGI